MGDYGFAGAGEFGGQDSNFNCLPDYHFSRCPNLSTLKDSKFSKKEYCLIASMSIEEMGQSSSSLCTFCGDDYRTCQRYVSLLGKK